VFHSDAACAALDALPDSIHRDALLTLAAYAVERTH